MKTFRQLGLIMAAAVMLLVTTPLSGTASADDNAPACDAGFVLDDAGASCVQTTAPAPTDPACPAGAQGEPGSCFEIVALVATGEQICTTGTLTTNGEAPACLLAEQALTPASCPTGFEPADTNCSAAAAAVQGPEMCPANESDIEPTCYSLGTRGPDEVTCSQGELVNDQCLVVTEPLFTPPSCPGEIIPDFGCGMIENVDNEVCPDGSVPVGFTQVGLECFTSLEIEPGVLSCPDGGSLEPIAEVCETTTDPLVTPGSCGPGAADINGECRVTVDPIPGGFSCIDPTATLDGTTCVTTADAIPASCPTGFVQGATCQQFGPTVGETACPAGSTATDAGCQRALDNAPVGPACATPAVLTDGVCVTTVATNRAAVAPYPGPFTNMPAGSQPSLLHTPAMTAQAPSAAGLAAATAGAPASTLAHTGSTSEPMVLTGLVLLGFGVAAMGLARRERRFDT